MGELFQFIKATLSTVVYEEVVNSVIETCVALWNHGRGEAGVGV